MLIGQVLGKYKIIEKIGSGRLADVYKGLQVGLEREVAVKVLPPERAKDPALVQRFRKESQATAKLSHPNIITIYDSGEQDGTYFYVMEYLAAESLADKFDQGGFGDDLKKSLKVGVDILKALVYCHEKGVVHQDLKPASVRFDMRGNAIVTDFGIEKNPDEIDTGDLAKAAQYLSPELYLKKGVDHRSDIYQFGAILYQLVTGKTPYPGKLPFVDGVNCEDKITPPAKLCDKVIPELDSLIMQALATDPNNRYQATDQILKELQKVERKQNIRQMSRQMDAPGYGRPSGAYTGSYSGVTGSMVRPSGISQSISGISAVDSLIQSQGFVSFIESLTGGYGDVTQRETQIRLAVVVGPFFILGILGVLYLLGIIGQPPLHLLEQAKEVESRAVKISWKSNAPSYSFIEFYTSPDRKRQTRPSKARMAEFSKKIEGLRPDTKYFFRFGFSRYEDGTSAEFSSVYDFKTRPEIKIRDIQVVDRKDDQVTIRWSTNLETDTKVRIGLTRDYTRVVENPDQRRELDHSIVIHGLNADTTYHYQIVAMDPEDPDQEVESDDKRFVTRTERSLQERGRPLKELAKSYVDKLTRMTPDEKEKLERSLSEFLPSVENLTKEKKKELLQGQTTLNTFHERRQYLSLWIEQFKNSSRKLPEGPTKEDIGVEADYLKSLYYVNGKRAIERLDICIERIGEADESLR